MLSKRVAATTHGPSEMAMAVAVAVAVSIMTKGHGSDDHGSGDGGGFDFFNKIKKLLLAGQLVNIGFHCQLEDLDFDFHVREITDRNRLDHDS